MIRARTRAECDERFELIYSRDPAVDAADADRVARYRKTWNVEDLRGALRAGVEPTRFTCRLLSANETLTCDGQPNEYLRHFWAFRYGFESVTALDAPEPWKPAFEDGDASRTLKGPSASDLAERVGMDVVQEIGRGILARAHLMVTT